MKPRRTCELCGGEAALHCESDAVFLCWGCDGRVHAANFLVARHVRRLVCPECNSVDEDRPISGAGSRPSLFPCRSCHRTDDDSASSSSISSSVSSSSPPCACSAKSAAAAAHLKKGGVDIAPISTDGDRPVEIVRSSGSDSDHQWKSNGASRGGPNDFNRHCNCSAVVSNKNPDSLDLPAAHKNLQSSDPSATEMIVFSIVCPANRVDHVIGSSMVHQVHLETGATIKIGDPIPGLGDLIITILGSGCRHGEEDGISPAQRALLRVFESIQGVGNGEKFRKKGLVVSKLLVLSVQVGGVLGQGGKRVDKIRKKTGARINLLREQAPAWVDTEEVIILITGSFSAVKNALLAVSACLYEFSPHVTSVPDLVEALSRDYSSNSGTGVVASVNKEIIVEVVQFRMLCSNEEIRSILGDGGVIIKALQSETGASISISKAVPDSDERVIIITALEKSEFKHSPAQGAVLHVHSILTLARSQEGAVASARLLFTSRQVGCLFDKVGNTIAEMRSTGANIMIFQEEHVPKCGVPGDELVQVTGSFQSVQDALLCITSRFRETIFPLKSSSISLQTTTYGNHGGIPDVRMGLGSGSGGVGSGDQSHQTAGLTTTIAEVAVPYQFLSLVYGENDSNLTRIREVSGATVTILDPKPEGIAGTVIISGKSFQTLSAQHLVHEFIHSGLPAQTSS